jgi:hypothetical protein
MKPDLLTRFVFNDTVIVEVSQGTDTVMVEVLNVNDPGDGGRTFHLLSDEIDLFINTLSLYKNRIMNPKK